LKSLIFTYLSLFQLKEEVSVIGRICCDSNGKLNSQSVILEGSQELSSGQQIKLDLSELRQFALFPGQVNQFILLEMCSLCNTPRKISCCQWVRRTKMWVWQGGSYIAKVIYEGIMVIHEGLCSRSPRKILRFSQLDFA